MKYQFMDVLDAVKEDLIREGMDPKIAEVSVAKLIWILVCRL